jgi:hypothetical protein
MPTVHVPAHLTVEHLMEAVQEMSSAERQEFKRRWAEWEAQNGSTEETEAQLIRAAQARLPVTAERQLRRLASKCERGTLTPKELATYQTLAQQAERLDVTRVEALAELVRRRGKPATVVMQEIGWKSAEGGR